MQYSILNRELYIIEYLGKDYLFTYETSLLLPNLSSFHFFQKTTAFFQLFSARKDASLISAARASSTCFVTRATRFNSFRFFDILFSSLRFLFLLSRFLSRISSLVFGRESRHCLGFLFCAVCAGISPRLLHIPLLVSAPLTVWKTSLECAIPAGFAQALNHQTVQNANNAGNR